MEYGRFIEKGSKYEILTPLTPTQWKNCLYNDNYYLELDQMLQGGGYLVEDYNRKSCISEERYFYLADRKTGEVWNPNFTPLAKEYDSYSCIHGMWETELRSVQQKIATNIRAMVPVTGERELWSISLQNQSEETREISLYTMFGFYDHGVMGGECIYDTASQVIMKYAFPYHTLYEEKEAAEKQKAYFYLFSDRKPDSVDMSRRRFFGNQGKLGIPQGVKNGKLSGIPGEAEDFCGAFAYDFCLKPGATIEVFLEAGAAVAREQILEQKERFDRAYVEKKIVTAQDAWGQLLNTFYMETPDENLNAFGNYWLKKQITLLTRQNRGSSYCPVRNQLQDAMGYALFRPEEAENYLFDAMKLQQKNGFIQQWHDTTGVPPRGLCLLNHTDGPVWLVIAVEVLIRQSGDRGMLSRIIPYADGTGGTVSEHLIRALYYLLEQTGEHGLCLMGDGDWNDPINGVGRKGKGESVWLSMALVYAIGRMLPYLKNESAEFTELSAAKEKMKQAINEYAWSEKWYAAAIHDDGGCIGDKNDRLFLNTQSWAILSEVADAKKRRILAETLKELETPFGPIILYPPFREWNARWGRISVKKAGTTENGSVYCHASMFLAYAKAMEQDGDGLYEILAETLPTNSKNPPEHNLQIPVYLPNYYYALRESQNFGRSSRHYGTGSAAWMEMLIMEELIGVKTELDGIRIQPLLPAQWDRITCRKRYKNALYDIVIKRGSTAAVYVNGSLCEEKYLPYQEGMSYQVEVSIM